MTTKPLIRCSVVDQRKDFDSYELVLSLRSVVPNEKSAESPEIFECVLRGVWFGCEFKSDETIHLLEVSRDSQTGQYLVDNDNGYVVQSPDVLISSTTLMSANYCIRKAWLSSKFSGWLPGNRAMLIGTIVHQLFQNSCLKRIRGIEKIKELFLSDLSSFIHNLYAIEITNNQIIEDVVAYIPSIAEWINKYVYSMSNIEDTNSQYGSQTNEQLQIIRVLDIEESVWNPKWGLKGIIDLTVEVAIGDNQFTTKSCMPLELKTGRASFSNEHIGQVGIYSIMMDDMRPVDALLLYLKDKPQMRKIVTKRPVKRDLIQLRNRLVKALGDIESGPTPLNNMRVCKNCDHLLDCSLTLKTLEPAMLAEAQVMEQELVPEAIEHLSQNELNFFKKWVSLLNLETRTVLERDADTKFGFWTEPSSLRELKGIGFSNVILMKITEDSAIFVRSDQFSGDSKDFDVFSNVMRRWERVAISLDITAESSNLNTTKRIALAMGYIKNIDCKQIEIILDKKVNRLPPKAIFRIDHLSSSGMITSNYTNLLHLMDPYSTPSETLRRIIIRQQPVQHLNKLKRQIVIKGKHILKPLNRVQQSSILKCLSTDSYQLLRGMPGAGKTQTIIAMIRLLVALEQTVLITSYTHAAVDNILLKLKEHDIDFLRIGSEKRVDPNLHAFTVEAKTSSFKTLEELEHYYTNVNVVAATCLGVAGHPIFNRRVFDYCIVDEASQVLLPTCLGPLFYCNRFLLVGDPKQLPPVVQSEEAKKTGLEDSLFVLLQNDSNTTDLTIQYRMNSEVMRISNELTYNGVLKCANYEVLTQTLSPSDSSFLNLNNWLSIVLSPELNKSVQFLDTDSMPAPEVRDNDGKVMNETEAQIVKQIVNNFFKYFELSPQSIGVISPYQRQVRLLKQTLDIVGLDINTVDQFQGRDKQIIIYSCVRSNSSETNFAKEILNDKRRLNVALTRAKKKLILVGSRTTLIRFKPFEELFAILRDDQILSIDSNVLL